MSSLPNELYKKILVRLPVKSILICKCVCKTWYAFISTRDFVKMHLNFTVQRNNSNLMLTSFDCTSTSVMHSISYDAILSSVNGIEYVCGMDYPFKGLQYDVKLLGSCDGLVSLWFSDHTNEKEFFCVWNPATKIYKKLPKSPSKFGVGGFVYDHIADDYKLLNVVDTSSVIEVYSLRSNSWRTTRAIPFRIPMRDMGVFVNGFYHWLGEKNQAGPLCKVIVSLDISKERFEAVQLPKLKGFREKTLFYTSVGVLEDCLCVVGYLPYEFQVWIMQDYGVRESWTKRFVISSENFPGSMYAKLMRSFKNGKIVFTIAGALVLYDPKDESLTVRSIDGLDNMIEDELTYFESLVPLDSSTCMGGGLSYKARFNTLRDHILCPLFTKTLSLDAEEGEGIAKMSSVPDELYKEILIRLPVKSIVTCKCVCKTWYAFISTRDFVKMHLRLTIQRNNSNLMLTSFDSPTSSLMHSISYDAILSSANGIEYDCGMDYPFKGLQYDVRLLGSCNGLVCLWFTHQTNETEFFCVWNPATKIYKKLPKSPSKFGVGGFVYDHIADDYKLLNVVDVSSVVEVYSLGSNYWRSTPAIPFRIPMRDIGVFVNGFYHWLGEKNRAGPLCKVIVSLDISKEKFEAVQLPNLKKFGEKKLFYVSVGVLEDCLCVVGYFPYEFQVWIMQDYGVRESWTRRFVISSENFPNSMYAKLMRSFKNGKIVFTIAGALVLYDTKDESLTVRSIDGLDNMIEDELTYFESLVPLDSSTYVGQRNE